MGSVPEIKIDWLIEIWSESKIREVGWNVMKFNVQDAMTDE